LPVLEQLPEVRGVLDILSREESAARVVEHRPVRCDTISRDEIALASLTP
jgi:hypothetical protein